MIISQHEQVRFSNLVSFFVPEISVVVTYSPVFLAERVRKDYFGTCHSEYYLLIDNKNYYVDHTFTNYAPKVGNGVFGCICFYLAWENHINV